ncbi:(3R)-3-[(carboxymethyl)amino]fatty acid oxygenase/decarboxylase [Streptomyces sp. NBC_01233]|uniref:(3R)-3-[(carboxymethyl)amino]fatty acid oxygenase/decarboxylase n=1 Tax=Streptomyces sp. NBC_01233 TaxID=2903787 RepID=UPI002E13D018|nr:TauD/TfdA family dioxygenase [Streptomyces sp. NBC_01233]
MEIRPQDGKKLGVVVSGFDAKTSSDEDVELVKKSVYSDKIVVLKNQHMGPQEFLELGRRFGEPETYYQPMYHHPEVPEIFVSSNVVENGKRVGVPQTGKFWHSDYSFMPLPFALTFIYPQVVPKKNRGTYFIDMGKAYEKLPEDLKSAMAGTRARHSVRRYFKIRPSDVYRPLAEVIAEMEEETPDVFHPTVVTHPVTGEEILYISAAVVQDLIDADDRPLEDGLLQQLLAQTGQFDTTFEHENIHLQTFEEGDLLIWDNRSLIHRALHTAQPEPAVSFRVTVQDGRRW